MKKKLISSIIFIAFVVPLLSVQNSSAETYFSDTVTISGGYEAVITFSVDSDNTDVTVKIDVKSGPSVKVVLSGHISSTTSSKSYSVTLNARSYSLHVQNWGSSTARVKIKISSGFTYWGAVIVVALIIGVVLIVKNKSSKSKTDFGRSSQSPSTDHIYGSTGSSGSTSSRTVYYPSRQSSNQSSSQPRSPTSSQPSSLLSSRPSSQPTSQTSTPSGGTIFCHNCGGKISSTAKFCDLCGYKQ
ncbi:MAG: zinc ribbon domain-containing protein [Candidatus Kariarchaeaceae archaeon]